MKFFKHLNNLKNQKEMMKSPKMRKMYKTYSSHMDRGTKTLQDTCEVCLLVAMVISLMILTGMMFSINLIIGDVLLFIASGLLYWRLCNIMVQRINRSQNHKHNK